MREIRFRALAPDKKGNLKWFDDVITDGQEVWIETKHQGIKHLKEIKALVQYTGLKDKQGVEIYENDVLHIENIGIVCVVFDKPTAGFMLRHKIEVDRLGVFKQYCFCEIELSEAEIIGYSTGELNPRKEGFEPSVWSEACHENDIYLANLITADAKI